MASTDARPVPIKNTAYRIYFGIYKNDGTLITGAAGLDSEVSKDGGNFADCTNEATEIQTSGTYFLDLTSTEMNADNVLVVVKTSATGAVIPTFSISPNEAGDIDVDVTAYGGTAGTFSGGRPEVNTTLIEGSDATNQIRDAVVDDATRIDASALNTLSGHDPGETIMGATDLGTGAGLTTLATQASVNTIDDLLDTEIGALTSELAKVPKSDGTASWNATALAAIQSEANDALVAYDPPTRAESTSDADSILAAVADVPTNAELATALAGADDAVLAVLGTPAGVSLAADIAAVKVDTAAILVDTGTTLDGKIDDIKANTDKFANLPVLTAGGTGGQGYGAP